MGASLGGGRRRKWPQIPINGAETRLKTLNSRRVNKYCAFIGLFFMKQSVSFAIKDKQVKYFIYDSTWNKNWDEWVPESRVFKYVDTNCRNSEQELQKAYQEQYSEGKMRGAALGNKTSGLQQKNVEMKTKKNKQETPGNEDGGSTSETDISTSSQEKSPSGSYSSKLGSILEQS